MLYCYIYIASQLLAAHTTQFLVWLFKPNTNKVPVLVLMLNFTMGPNNFLEVLFGQGTKVYVQNRLEPSSGILHHNHLTRGSAVTSQDDDPSSVVYIPELI